jgi:hypothetical protein
LYFLPLPQGQGSLRPTLAAVLAAILIPVIPRAPACPIAGKS